MSEYPRGLGPLPGSAQPFLVRLHIGTVVFLVGQFAVLAALAPPAEETGFDFGPAFALGAIFLAGLPWSLAVLDLADSDAQSVLFVCGFVGAAALDVGLHVALYRWTRRRRGLPAPL